MAEIETEDDVILAVICRFYDDLDRTVSEVAELTKEYLDQGFQIASTSHAIFPGPPICHCMTVWMTRPLEEEALQ